MAQAQRLITADYNGLSNKPIINASLPVLPSPPANTYFRHTGSTTATFTNGVIYKWDGVEYKELGTGAQPIDLSKYIQADTLTGLLPNVQYALVHNSDNVFTLVEVEGGGTGTGWLIATSDLEVEALLINDNLGKFFMFIGESESEQYFNYALYQVVLDGNDIVPAIVFASADMIGDTVEDLSSDIDGKQDALVSGENIKTINDTSILGSGNFNLQETLVSGTNIKTINNQSILGEGNIDIQGGGSSDYNELENTPIINQYEVTNVNVVPFEDDMVIHDGDKARIFMNKEADLVALMNNLKESGAFTDTQTIPFLTFSSESVHGDGIIGIVDAEWENEGQKIFGPDAHGMLLAAGTADIIYATEAGVLAAGHTSVSYPQGWNPAFIDLTTGDYTFNLTSIDPAFTEGVVDIGETISESVWNNVLLGFIEEEIAIEPEPVDGKYYKRPDGDLYKYVEAVVPEHLIALEDDKEVHKGFKVRFNKNLDIDTFLNGLTFPDGYPVLQLYNIGFADGEHDNEVALEQLAIMDAGAMSADLGEDAKGIILVAGIDRILYATESGSIMDMDAVTGEAMTLSYTQGWNTDFVDENGDYEPQFISVVYGENPHYSTFEDGILGVSNQLNQELWNGVLVGEVAPAEDKSFYDKVVLQSELEKEEGSMPTFANEAEAIAFAKEENFGKVAQYVGENQLAQTTISYADRFTVVINKTAFINALSGQAGEVEFTFNGTDWLPDISDYGITVSGDTIEGDKFIAVYHGDGTFQVDDVVSQIYYADGADFSGLFTYSSAQAFVESSTTLKNGDKLHFDKTANWNDFLSGLSYQDDMCPFIDSEMFILAASHDSNDPDSPYVLLTSEESGFTTLYLSKDFTNPNTGRTYTAGWQDVVDADGDFFIKLQMPALVTTVNDDPSSPVWNGSLVGYKYPVNAVGNNLINSLSNDSFDYIASFNGDTFGNAVNNISALYKFNYVVSSQTWDILVDYDQQGYWETLASGVSLAIYGITLTNDVTYPDSDRDCIQIEYSYLPNVINILNFSAVSKHGDDAITGSFVASADGNLYFVYEERDDQGDTVKGINGEAIPVVSEGKVSPMANMIFAEFINSLTVVSLTNQSSWSELMSKNPLPSVDTAVNLVPRLNVEVDSDKLASTGAKVGSTTSIFYKDGTWKTQVVSGGTPISEADPQGGSVSIYGNTALDEDDVAALFDTAPFQPSGGGSGESQTIFTYNTPNQGERGANLYSFMGSWIVMVQDQTLGDIPIIWSNSPEVESYLGMRGWIVSNFTITTTGGISITEGYEDILSQLLSLTPFSVSYETVDIDSLGISIEGTPVEGDTIDIKLLESAYKSHEFYRVDAKDENLGANIGDEITTLYFDTNSSPVFSDFLNYTEFPLSNCGVFYASDTYTSTGETDGLFYVSLYDLGVTGASEEDIVIGTHMRSESLVPSSIVYSSIACTVDIDGEQASVSQGWSVDHYTYNPPFVAIGNEGYFSVYPVIMEENIKAIQKYVHTKPFDYIPEKIYFLYKFYLSPDESAGGGSAVIDLGNVISDQEGQFSPSDEVFELLENGATTIKMSMGNIDCYATLVEHGAFPDFYNADCYFFKGTFHNDPKYLMQNEAYDLTVLLAPDFDGVKMGHYKLTEPGGSGVTSIEKNGSSISGAVQLGDGLDIVNNQLVATGGASYSPITLTYVNWSPLSYFGANSEYYDTIANGKLFAIEFNSVSGPDDGSSSIPVYSGVALMPAFDPDSVGAYLPIHIQNYSGTTYVHLKFNPVRNSIMGDGTSQFFDVLDTTFASGSTIKVLRLL